MAGEARVVSSLSIRKASGSIVLIDYQSRPGAFTADVDGTKGPSPGSILISVNGTNIDLSQLGTPGLCRFHNQSASYSVRVGRWDDQVNRFYPFILLKPGESYVVRLDPSVEEEFTGTGTAIAVSAPATYLRAIALTQDVPLLVEAFDA